MIKSKNFGIFNCMSKSGKPKSAWDTSDEIIEQAKYLNKKYPSDKTKLIGYKCSHCHKHHLTTTKKRIR